MIAKLEWTQSHRSITEAHNGSNKKKQQQLRNNNRTTTLERTAA